MTAKSQPGETEREFTELPGLIVEFLPNAHRYNLIKSDEKVAATSPSTVLDVMIPKGRPYEAWLRRVGFEQADLEMEQGKNRGTVMHRVMQEYCERHVVPSLSDYEEAWRPWVAGVCSWLVEASPEPVLVEATVASWDLRMAGRFDLLALIDGKPTICDLKTRNRANVYEKDHLQIAFYQHLLAETFPEHATDEGLIVVVDGEANVRTSPCLASWEQSKAILDAFRAVREVQTSMKLLENAPEAEKAQGALL